ncbi:MAG: terpene cyclase/mutase family protein [Myxococcales bacterium]|nr:terpene cyclase/mutase family protein [Myxococcales bacterium]MCB9752380.1 terpene cyclase/mutase family protein [Myxococcales bacterium]
MALIDRLDEGIDRASQFVAARARASGRIDGGCEGRALETGLFLHLVRARGDDPRCEARLAGYCRRYLERRRGVARGLDSTVSEIICAHVLGGELSPAQRVALDGTLAKFDHPTRRRKRAFFTVLLAELGVISTPAIELSAARARRSSEQRWVSVILTSLRILIACQRGRAGEIGDDEVAFIRAQQGDGGGWDQHVLATIVALIALDRLGRAPDSVARGIAYVCRQIRRDGGVPFIADEDVWVTCLGGQVLDEARPSTCDLNAVARYVASLQAPDGGWAFSEGVRQTDADDTSVALTFLGRRDPVGHREAIRRAQWYLIALQNEDGGFPTFVRGAPSEAEITAKAITALRASSASHFGGRIERAWRWLADAQRDDGSFRAEWKLCATYPALHVLSAAAVSDRGELVDRVRAGVRASLRAWRRADGGWGLRPEGGAVHLLSTAYALAGLATDRDGLGRIELGRSVALLLEMQGRDGGFHGAGDSLGPRPFVYDVPLLASIYSLCALSRARRALLRHVHSGTATRARPRPRLVESSTTRARVGAGARRASEVWAR